jgi:hypothetical protein
VERAQHDKNEEKMMIKHVPRVLVGIIGLLSIFIAMNAWFSPAGLAKQFQLDILGPVGGAAMRADVGGIFLAIGVFALGAAWHKSRAWIFGLIILVGCALAGRLVGLVMDGAGVGTIPPMLIEMTGLAIFLWARSTWRKAPSGLL